MLQITPQMHIYLAIVPVDFRRGIDGMAQLCRQVLSQDPFSGAMYVFRSRSGKAIKILVYDGQGFWLCHKRLSQGIFKHWPKAIDSKRSKLLQAHELQLLLYGGDITCAKAAPTWRIVNISR